MRDEENMEAEIQAKGLNAPRLTPTLIDGKITGAAYYVFPGTTLTICALTLANGFQVTGESAAASPENFNEEIGRKIAYDNARQKIWALEGYLLRERLASGIAGIADPVVVDRGMLGAAAYAIERNIDAPETLKALRQASVGQATPAGGKIVGARRSTEVVTRDVYNNCWRNEKGDEVPEAEVVREGDRHVRMILDTDLGGVSGKTLGHDRSEEGAPSFKG